MLIGFRKKFLFIHVPKCAGESITELLVDPANGGGQFLGKHHVYAEAARVMGDDIRRFTVFAVVRNPFDQVVSFYEHLRKPLWMEAAALERQYPGSGGKLMPAWASELAMQHDFPDYVRQVYGQQQAPRGMMRDLCAWLTDAEGGFAGIRVLRYEQLAEEFGALSRELGLEGALPWLNASRNALSGIHPRDRYDAVTRRIIEERFSRTLSRFGYAF